MATGTDYGVIHRKKRYIKHPISTDVGVKLGVVLVIC